MARIIIDIKENITSRELDIIRGQIDLLIKHNDVAIQLHDRILELYTKE